ncbi:Cobalt transport protein [Bifidobacterium goeldii]|uniref:Cobalt transport protein n=1 Tax=Bifidobacterium goeldii TaxID=2306975 RepID=A0A430FJK6_9BIFI|nr:energy-coupling factor transporter transmembrane component T [Bifidobacterium goeldii]RSX53075.1 Cobalt transport protein [Bifidobacterium goeldii]
MTISSAASEVAGMQRIGGAGTDRTERAERHSGKAIGGATVAAAGSACAASGMPSYRGLLWCDPRTKIVVVFTLGCFCLTLAGGDAQSMIIVRRLLAFAPALLLLFTRRRGAGIGYALCLVGFWLVATFVLPHVGGPIGWLIYASVGMMTQMLPAAMGAYWMLVTTTASELIGALQRMHVPLPITVPIAVMFRFLPVALAEQRAINDAMRMRGVRFGGGKVGQMLEYRVVPLMTNSVRIADELTQSALTRGLGYDKHRTSIARIGFHTIDMLMLLLCAACYIAWGLTAMGILQ